MFDLDRFIADCLEAVRQDPTHKAAKEVVDRAITDPAGIMRACGEPSRGGVNKLYQSPELTVINLVWAPHMVLMPHNHEMWAVIGIYSGREDNIFWRRNPEDRRHIEAAGARSLGQGDVVPLGPDIIHSVTNPLPRCTGALHVYGGDFFEQPRSEWEPETLSEAPYDVNKTVRLFEEANARL